MTQSRWANFFEQPHEIDYPKQTMFQFISDVAKKYPNETAIEFQGKKTTYKDFIAQIELVAKSYVAMGIKEGNAVTICMPNTPQAILSFYALNRIGAIANMIHPLSAQGEITYYLDCSQSTIILTLDMFYEKVVAARSACNHKVTILMAKIQDALPVVLRLPYTISQKGKYSKLPDQPNSIVWNDFIKQGKMYNSTLPNISFKIDRTAVILYSGGTTGTNKGIMLSDLNFNALALQCFKAMQIPREGKMKMLAAMPLFHGFGLGVGIHTILCFGGDCYLVPNFNVKTYGQLLLKAKPQFIAGVPTLYEALLRTEGLEKADLSFLKGMFSGGDSLSIELKAKVDKFLADHGATIQVREGYGTTECVTASCLTPKDDYRPGSIGVGYPDTDYVICAPGTTEHLPVGEEGEICLSGPTVMLGYLNNEEETNNTLKVHADGKTYLHTGDLGYMDKDGFVYFKQRIKRMIVTSGYNVYPSQVENAIDGHPKVLYSCVIGVHDDYKMEKVKAFVVLKPNIVPDDSIKDEIKQYLSKHIAKYAMPYDIEFRNELPKTLVGKVAYRVLEQEEAEKNAAKK